ncbi:hypothetical protein Gpo141_00001981 [Globisporangium polare]
MADEVHDVDDLTAPVLPPSDGARKYACKICRHVVFTSDDLLDHAPQQQQIAMRKKVKDVKVNGHQTSGLRHETCSSYFLEETQPWMDEDQLAEGKIRCPNAKCQARVGSFDWCGSQCSCGTWVTPSVKITKSRVDPLFAVAVIPIVQSAMIGADKTSPAVAADGEAEQSEPNSVSQE